jgi:ubiquinone/menaquinone biosynthesis C-methylase UbiE
MSINQWDDDAIKAKIAQTIAQEFISASTPYISKQTTSMLDFGCGNGGITIELSKHVRHIVGVDPSEKPTDLFRSKIENMQLHNIEVITMDLLSDENRSFIEEHKFDAVTCSLTFHHVPDVQKTINVVYDLLKPGGVFVSCDLLKNEHSIGFHPKATRSHVCHLGGFTQEEITQLITKAGFKQHKVSLFSIDKMNAETDQMDQFDLMLIIAIK